MQRDIDRGTVPDRQLSPGGMLLPAAGVVVFVLIAVAVHHGWLADLDRAGLALLRQRADPAIPIGPHGLVSMVRDVTALGSFIVLSSAVTSVAAFLALRGRRDRALALLAYAIGGTLLGEAAKHVIARVRPDVVPHLVEVVTLSFPSAHAMQATAIPLVLACFLADTQPRAAMRVYLLCVAALVALAVGLSRLYLGVHWPTDVVAGWSLGTAWASACWLLDRRLRTRAENITNG
jgi:undecaprenyl-diphosphatase